MLYIEDIVPEPDPADGLISRACMARYLLGLMASDYSETYFFSSWATDLEYHLWDAVHGKRVEVALGTAMLEEDERKLILELATVAGGWWVWPRTDGAEDKAFIPMKEWKQKVGQRRADGHPS